jgi:hypothetical protein
MGRFVSLDLAFSVTFFDPRASQSLHYQFALCQAVMIFITLTLPLANLQYPHHRYHPRFPRRLNTQHSHQQQMWL